MSLTILVIGATSGIAEAVIRLYAEKGAGFFLVARNQEKLETISADLSARGASSVHTYVMDINDSEQLTVMLDHAWGTYKSFDLALIAHGTLPDQERTQSDITYAVSEFRNNAESVITCLTALADRFRIRGKGVIAVIGSVAGDRGRGSNYLYGAAKAAVDAFSSGLRTRMFNQGVHVLTIKPGFVRTAMTADLDLPDLLTVSPDVVARDIHRAITRRKDILYTPWYWRFLILIIKLLPNFIFKRINL